MPKTRFSFFKLSQIIHKFHYGGEKKGKNKKKYQNKTNELVFFNERMLLEKYNERDTIQDHRKYDIL